MSISYKPHPSEYELRYVMFPNIGFDKQQLLEFLEYRKKAKGELLETLNKILSDYPKEKLVKLLNNDPEVSRMCVIEKYARQAAKDILLTGKYHPDTFEVVTNLPLSDYQLLMKRSKEIISQIQSLGVQEESPKGMPGA